MSEQRNWYDNDADDSIGTGNNNGNGNGYNNGYNNSYNNDYYYYNNPNNVNRPDTVGTNPRLATASMVFGIASLATMWTGIGSLFCGAMGVIFANLSKRRGKATLGKAKAGLVMSVIGLVIGVFLLIYSMFIVSMAFATNGPLKEFKDEYSRMYEQVYGEEFDWSSLGLNMDDYQKYLDASGIDGN